MFTIHGEVAIRLDKNIILVALKGPFNEGGVSNWTEKLRGEIDKFLGKPFFILMNNVDYEGFTPEASIISNNFNLWLNEQQMVVKAIVQPSSLARKMNLRNIPALSSQRIEYFDTQTEAKSWIKKHPEYLNFEES